MVRWRHDTIYPLDPAKWLLCIALALSFLCLVLKRNFNLHDSVLEGKLGSQMRT